MRYRWDPVYPEYRRRATADANIRASDTERSEVAERLSLHYAEGRLDQTEFKARLDRAMGATTRGDLEGLFDDLPQPPVEAPPPRRHRHLLRAVVFLVLVAVFWGSTFSMVHFAWVPLLLLAFLAWRLLGGHHRRHDWMSEEHYHPGGPRS